MHARWLERDNIMSASLPETLKANFTCIKVETDKISKNIPPSSAIVTLVTKLSDFFMLVGLLTKMFVERNTKDKLTIVWFLYLEMKKERSIIDMRSLSFILPTSATKQHKRFLDTFLREFPSHINTSLLT